MTPLILALDSPEASIENAGGKAAGLAKLVKAGFPVPPGYIVTTRAYTEFVAAAGLMERIRERLPAERAASAALQAASDGIRALFEQTALGAPLASAITEAWARLAEIAGTPAAELAVAVRSSATAEDLATASFAGQQDTFLNVRGVAAILDAVRSCWASLWTARAIAYRSRLRIAPQSVKLAVLVQQLVPAARAGVLFTINPLTGNSDEMVANATWGLGDAVAAGRVVPDSVTLDKRSGRILRQEIGSKILMTVPGERTVKDVPVEPERRSMPVLNAPDAARLARLGADVERLAGVPQDVEWAMVSDHIYLLQARAITAAGAAGTPGDDVWPALNERPAQPFDVWTLANVGELWPEPVSPMVASAIPAIIGGAVRYSLRGVNARYLDSIQWAKRFYGRIYYNEGALKHVISHELGLPASLLDRSRGNRSLSPGGGFRPLKLLLHLPVLFRLATRQRRTGRAVEEFLLKADQWVAAFAARKAFPEDDRAVWEEGLRWLERTKEGMNLQNEMSGLALAALGTLEALLFRWFQRRDLAHDLVTGVANIQSAQIGMGLWHIAQSLREAGLVQVITVNEPRAALEQLRRDPRAAPVLARLDEFLAQHGHRCPNEAEWLHPRWYEAPEQVLTLVAAYVGDNAPAGLEETARKQRQRREAAEQWVEGRLGPLRRVLFRRVLARAQHALRLRDNGKSAAIKVSYPARRLSAILGARWAEWGWLAEADDVFFLTVPDMERLIAAGDPGAAGIDLRTLVTGRRRAFQSWFGVNAPEVLGPEGHRADEPSLEQDGGRQLRGIAASGGRVRGTARVARTPEEAFKLGPSDILVTRATDVGWTAAFPLIGGLVTEIGGQLSHAAIVAREYGLPAVVGVTGATSVIADGQMLVLDGGTGTIALVEEDAGGERRG
jgi:pyruvate,water dikinase